MTEQERPSPIGQIKDKLIRSKEKWAEEGRLITGMPDAGHRSRLPPGQREVKNWPVLDLGAQPDVKPENWRLQVTGAVENPFALTLPQFLALPQTEIVSDIHCVTAWSRFDNHWRGVSSRALLDLVKPKPEARHVLFIPMTVTQRTQSSKSSLTMMCCLRIPGRAHRSRANTVARCGW